MGSVADDFNQLDDSDWSSPLQDLSKELLNALFLPITTVNFIKSCGKKIVEIKGNFFYKVIFWGRPYAQRFSEQIYANP